MTKDRRIDDQDGDGVTLEQLDESIDLAFSGGRMATPALDEIDELIEATWGESQAGPRPGSWPEFDAVDDVIFGKPGA